MAEYIDRQKLIDDFQTAGSCFVYGDYIPAIVSRIKIQPTIEPEAMPAVQELQAHVKEQKEQLAHLEYWELDRKQVLKSAAGDRAAVKAMQKHCEKTIAELRAEMKRVTAERDAAIEDLRLFGHKCNCCKHFDRPFTCIAPEPCGVNDNWEWRGPVAENATAERDSGTVWKETVTIELGSSTEKSSETGQKCVRSCIPEKVFCDECKNADNPEKCLLAGCKKPISTFCSAFERKEKRDG